MARWTGLFHPEKGGGDGVAYGGKGKGIFIGCDSFSKTGSGT